VKESAFPAEVAKVLTAEEFSRHQEVVLKHAGRGKGDGGGVDTMGQLLLSGAVGGEFAGATRSHLEGFQQPDGSWKPNGQLRGMNRAEGEATALTTMWVAIALGPKSEAAIKGAGFARRRREGRRRNGWSPVRSSSRRSGIVRRRKGF
jgi:hypothetical protein